MIERVFPPDIVAVAATPRMWKSVLQTDEATAIAHAVAKRQREFAAGRACARQALVRLGFPDYLLLNDIDGVPIWPDGVVGCLAHCAGYCGAAVARKDHFSGVGFDAEPGSALVKELHNIICSDQERRWIDDQAPPIGCDWYKLFFCAKESSFKAAFPILRFPFDFWKVEITFRPDLNEFKVDFPSPYRLFNDRVVGRFTVSQKHILTGVAIYR